MKYTLTSVAITNIQTTATASTDLRPTDTFAVTFQGVTWTYTPTNANGSPGTPVVLGWDLSQKP